MLLPSISISPQTLLSQNVIKAGLAVRDAAPGWGVEMKLPEGGSGGQSEGNEKQALQN